MKRTIITLCALILSGCASTPSPNYLGGKYFMAGDPDCVRARLSEDKSHCICFNDNGEFTGNRNEISKMQADAWYKRQAQDSAQLSNIISNMNKKTSVTCYTTGNITTCN